jgi:hypothetical protein
MVEWVLLALDNKQMVNISIRSFHSQKVRKLGDKVNKYKFQKWHCYMWLYQMKEYETAVEHAAGME